MPFSEWEGMKIPDLKAECRKRGINVHYKDTMKMLKDRLETDSRTKTANMGGFFAKRETRASAKVEATKRKTDDGDQRKELQDFQIALHESMEAVHRWPFPACDVIFTAAEDDGSPIQILGRIMKNLLKKINEEKVAYLAAHHGYSSHGAFFLTGFDVESEEEEEEEEDDWKVFSSDVCDDDFDNIDVIAAGTLIAAVEDDGANAAGLLMDAMED
ncbi:hypothetical protein PRZ48_001804 [Zasmidium cellare]|uniref:Uncharacterized protein n=1 Tax=Zasmidium cellare TaxID=395010 RepID=A0ABR0F2H4_ZASCE|nr:hypothetical protein PRZ48_001804 [Zasmidium cellare]